MPRIPDSDGLFHQGLKVGKPYLGSPSVVDGLLRGALKDVNHLRIRQLAGEQFDVVASIKAIAIRLQDIFYGRSSDYQSGDMHQPGVLGHALVMATTMGGSEEDAVYRQLHHMINLYLADYRKFEADEIDDGEFQMRLQKLVVQYTHSIVTGGSVKKPKPSKPAAASAAIHPKTNDHGEPVRLHQPHEDGDAAHWGNPEKIATFTPRGLGGDCPHALYGVSFKPWTDHPKTAKEWSAVDGQMPGLDEPPPPRVPKGKHLAAGVVVEEPDGRVWTISPSNGFGGYKNTFPKGRVEDGIDMQASAIKEAFEESGLKVEITGFLVDVERSTTTTRFYRARRVGGDPTEMGWEAQAVHLVPREALAEHLTNKNDAPLVAALTTDQ